jgi:MraZ protein
LLIGEFQHSVDPKGRLFMPAKFRDDLGESFIVTKGLDNCLFVYSIEEWKVLEEKIRALPLARSRDLQRFFFSGAAVVEADKQGRILLPQNLRSYASLEKDAVIIGASNRVEIWNLNNWKSTCENLTSDMIADAMTELGF